MIIIVKNLLGQFIKIQNLKKMSLEDLKKLNFPDSDMELGDKDIDIRVNTCKVFGRLKQEQQARLCMCVCGNFSDA